MTSGGSSFLKKVVLVVVLLSPFAFFSSKIAPWQSSSSSVTVAQEILYPLERAWKGFTQGIGNFWKVYFNFIDAAKENLDLKDEMTLLKAKILDYDEKVVEIKRLRKVLGFTKTLKVDHLVSEVINTPGKLPFKSIRIAAGKNHGIQIGMPVVSEEGIIGKVVRVGFLYSDVQLIVDSNFHLDILLQRTRVRGVLKGFQGNLCQLKLSRKAQIRIGDTVISSGIVGAFPKGLPIGKVVRINYETENISQVVTIEPWVNYKQLEEVVIIKSEDYDLNNISNTVGSEWLEKAISPDQDKG